MVRVAFIMRAHPRDETACLVGGAVKNPFRLLRALRRHDDVVGVLVADGSGRFDAGGYPVIGIRLPPLKLYARTLAWNVAALPTAVRLFREADVVQCHHPHFGLAAALLRAWRFRSVAFVVKAHGTATPELAANRYGGLRGAVLRVNAVLHLWHDRFVLARADRVLVSSDHQRDEMVRLYGVPGDRVTRIYNGVDPEFLRVRTRSGPDAVRAPRFVFVGRLVPKKGLAALADLWPKLLLQLPGATLTLVLGHRRAVEDAATHQLVRERLERLPSCRVRFDLDERELFSELAASDVGLVPSRGYESIPTVVLEMCRAGLPVFATPAWGIPEVLPASFALTGDADVDAERLAAFVGDDLGTWDSAAWSARYASFDYDRLAPEYRAVWHEVLATCR